MYSTLSNTPASADSTAFEPAGGERGNVLRPHALRVSRKVVLDLVAACETGTVIAGCAGAALIFGKAGHSAVNWVSVLQLGLIAALVVQLCLNSWGMYEARRVGDLPCSALKIMAATALACLSPLGLGLPAPVDPSYLLAWYGAWLGLCFGLLLTIRRGARCVLSKMASAGCFDLRVAVFGAGAIARHVEDGLQDTRSGIRFVGLFDDRNEAGRGGRSGVSIMGTLDDLVSVGRADGVDQIIIALPASASERIEQVARKLEQLPVSLQVVTHIASDLISPGPAHEVSAIGSIGLLAIKRKPLSDWAPIVKRVEDYVIASVLTCICLPLFALIALAVKIEDGGPILFVQRRRGLNQRIIHVLKFRSMRVMEDGATIRQAEKCDPRVTCVGRFLRRSSLDELPQLINVLRGDMSLVGPRPHAIAHDEYYGDILARYINRHQVKPGITGLAQVRGLRGETKSDDKMQSRVNADLEYITNWSPWLDLKILAGTLFSVLRGSNAH